MAPPRPQASVHSAHCSSVLLGIFRLRVIFQKLIFSLRVGVGVLPCLKITAEAKFSAELGSACVEGPSFRFCLQRGENDFSISVSLLWAYLWKY